MIEIFAIEPNTNYIVSVGDSDFSPNSEQLQALEEKLTPLFREKGSSIAVVSRATLMK